MPARAQPIERILEPLTLRAAREVAARTPAEARARVVEGLARARREADAADAIFCDGHRAEAARLLAAAVEHTLALVDDAHARALAARGIRPARLAALLAALRAAPAHDEAFGAIHATTFLRALAARRRLDDALALASAEPRALGRRRAVRAAALALAVIVPAILAVVPWPELTRVRAWASGQWAYDAHFPEEAVDGDPATEWQAPNQTGGWLDVRISPPVDVARLRILNGHNGEFADRGCAIALVRLYRRGEEVGSFHHRWRRIEPAPEWVTFEVGARAVDRIRVDVPTYFGMGIALAEVAWE